MLRTDFVSNSSSSSFIIDASYEIKIDNRFLKILSCVENYVYFRCKNPKWSNDIITQVTNHSNFKIINEEIQITDPKYILSSDLNLVKSILNESDSIICNCGEDWESECITTQICTLLEIYYNIVPEGEDHFSYNSVSRITEKTLDDEEE